MERTICHDWHVAHGGRMVEFAGWHMPVQYTTLVAEHRAVRQAAGLFDIAHMGRLRFTGPDALNFLDRILTNDVSRLQVGDVRYSLVCHERGGVLDDVLIYRYADAYGLVVNASNRAKINAWIEEHHGGFQLQVRDETCETFMLALQGPRAIEILQPLTPAALAVMKYYTVVETSVLGVPATLSRTGYTGEDGFEVVVPNVAGLRVWEELIARGASLGLVPCGLGARDTLRLEAAMPLYGHELDEDTDPLTAGVGFGVKLRKGSPFIGREALLRIESAPVDRVRVGLQLAGRRIPRENMAVMQAGVAVGRVTSGTLSPTLDAPIAMAYVSRASSAIGTSLQIDVRGQAEATTVVKLPFYKRPA